MENKNTLKSLPKNEISHNRNLPIDRFVQTFPSQIH